MLDQPHAPDLLKLVIASDYSPAAAEEWQKSINNREIDWISLAQKAYSTGLAPLLYSVITRSFTGTIPDEVHRLLRQCYQETAAYNLLALNYLQQIQSEANLCDLQLVVLKGAGLINSVYGNIAVRPMVDLDLLIHYEDLGRMRALLSELGFKENGPPPFTNPSGLFWNESLFIGPVPGKVQIELHWHLIDIPYYARKLPTHKLLKRSVHSEIDGQAYRILAADDQLIHLSMHNTYHHRNRLDRALVDIAHVSHRHKDTLDWQRLIETTCLGEVIGSVTTNLSLAASGWFAPVPTSILSQLAEFRMPVRERFFIRCQRSEFLKIGRTWLTLPGLTLKLRFIQVQLFPDRNYLDWRYGKGTGESLMQLTMRRYASGLAGLLSELRRKIWSSAGGRQKNT